MAEEKSKEELKKEAAEKAKAAAQAKMAGQSAVDSSTPADAEKAKAVAIAKAKAAAAAKAKAAAQAKTAGQSAVDSSTPVDAEKAKAIAIAKAKAAAAAKAKALAAASSPAPAQQAEPEKPSLNQPLLNQIRESIRLNFGQTAIEDSYINKLSKDVPTIVVKKENYLNIALLLKEDPSLAFDFLAELHGTDFGKHMEVYVHLHSLSKNLDVALKVKLDRDYPEVDSLSQIWPGASWPESEAYDLLGIRFKGNPDLHRIFLGENWVGYPLRKDYQPIDGEVAPE